MRHGADVPGDVAIPHACEVARVRVADGRVVEHRDVDEPIPDHVAHDNDVV